MYFFFPNGAPTSRELLLASWVIFMKKENKHKPGYEQFWVPICAQNMRIPAVELPRLSPCEL